MKKTAPGAARMVARATLVAALGAIAGVLACSFIISDKLPAFMCAANSGPGACPAGEVCTVNGAGTQFTCAPRCTAASCATKGQLCDSVTGICVMPEGGSDIMMTEDAPGLVPMDASAEAPINEADTDSKLGDADADGDSGSRCNGFGCSCATASDCAPQFACAGKLALTQDIWSALTDADSPRGDAGANICVQPCCISNDCAMDDGGSGAQVCFATGAGGNYCLPPSWLGDRATIGMGLGGAPCADDSGTPCRSGLCVAGVCADTCCSNRLTQIQCSPTSVCRFAPFAGGGFDKHETATCAPPNGGHSSGGSTCAVNSDCKSNFCSGGDGGPTSGDVPTCREACRNASDCAGSTRTPPSCGYLQLPTSADLVSACMPSSRGVGDAGGGNPCQASSDCARGYCAPQGNGRSACLATCFIDNDDCLPTERCRPQPLQVGNAIYSVLACGM